MLVVTARYRFDVDTRATVVWVIKTQALLWIRNSLLLFVVVRWVWYVGCTQEGHELEEEDIGETISVGGSEFTLLSIIENKAELSGPYVGADVLEG